MANILLVGTATLDLVFTLEHAPGADEEMRAQQLRTVRGGNAANSAVVLSQLGHRCHFVGTLADAPESAVITEDFVRYGIDFQHSPRLPGKPPTSSIYLSHEARSIVHYRDLPELTADALDRIALDELDWAHFEGRNVQALSAMMHTLRRRRPALPVSLELEKPRPGIEQLYTLPDWLLCSRGFAEQHSPGPLANFLCQMRKLAPQAGVIVAAGSEGAYGMQGAQLHHASAQAPGQVIDTLGAGDTFNAAIIAALLSEQPLPAALHSACALAGRKCGMRGFNLHL